MAGLGVAGGGLKGKARAALAHKVSAAPKKSGKPNVDSSDTATGKDAKAK